MTPRLARVATVEEWRLSELLGDRPERLLDVPTPGDLLALISRESETASRERRIAVGWEPSCDRPGYFRLAAQVPLTERTFDQLFNGRSGYRAQYYLSPEEGILFNRELIAALEPALRASHSNRPLPVEFEFAEASLRAPHSKVWVYNEKVAFDEAAHETLNPPRWVSSGKTRGRRAPLPDHYTVDVKGTFINPPATDFFVDEPKLDRACDLFNCGYT